MGTELVRACLKEGEVDSPALPPGFEAFTRYKLKKEEDTEREISNSVLTNLSEQNPQVTMKPVHNDSRKITRSHRRRPSTNHGQCSNSDDDCDSEQLDESTPMKASLPKGVIRGCPECKNCQKVVARYKPEAACRPNLDEAPVFRPTEQEFEDTLSYIGKIRHQAEPYGICRIVPPPSWKPPCHLKEKNVWEHSMFSTRIQKVDKLQNREPARKTYNHTRKRRRCSRMGVDNGAESGNILEPLEFGFEPGPDFTLDAFQKYADEFKAHYFRGSETNSSTETAMFNVLGKLDPPIDIIEGEYWRVVERPTEEIEVLYGADLETGAFGSGFPRTAEQASSPDEQYVKSGWNLNNLPRLAGSVLAYENPHISGVQVPWLYVGMCFSSFCLHVEDHYLYSLNYNHFGAPKLWYGVPGKDATKLEEAMRKHLPHLFDEQPDLLHKLVTQLSPTILKSEGVPVYRCVQNPGEFVITFPRAYHGGFNCGFNCAEAVNVAPLDWFPHGQNAVELYREQKRKTTISHDKLLLGAAVEAVIANWEISFLRKNTSANLKLKNVCGDGILAKSLRARVNMERARRDFLCKSAKVLKMLSDFDVNTERECSVCYFDLHLSAAGCRCSPDRFACLNHAKELCSCAWSDKFFLFRYDIDELDVLVEAIEGKLSAVYRWARSYLGFSLSSKASEDPPKVDDVAGLLSSSKTPSEVEIPSRLTLLVNRKPLTPDNPTTGAVAAIKKLRIKKDLLKPSTSNVVAADLQQPSRNPEVKKSLTEQDVIFLSDDEEEQLDKPLSGCPEEAASLRPRTSESIQSVGQNVVIALGVQRINKTKDETPVQKVEPKVLNDASTVQGSLSCGPNSVEKHHNQKGPRIAKVVRRLNCNAEALEFGSVVSGKLWSNNRAIFPKGFKSRVWYMNILDPTNLCHYISEVLDRGEKGPLFMVSLEQCPSEVFVHVTITRCWEMVRERVNQEISRQHKLGKLKLPPLQPPGSLDGYEMFGFTSPAIIQAIEALDKNRLCADYWNSRPITRVSQPLKSDEKSETANSAEAEGILRGLFKKANNEELHALLGTLGDDKLVADSRFLIRLLKDEIGKRVG